MAIISGAVVGSLVFSVLFFLLVRRISRRNEGQQQVPLPEVHTHDAEHHYQNLNTDRDGYETPLSLHLVTGEEGGDTLYSIPM